MYITYNVTNETKAESTIINFYKSNLKNSKKQFFAFIETNKYQYYYCNWQCSKTKVQSYDTVFGNSSAC